MSGRVKVQHFTQFSSLLASLGFYILMSIYQSVFYTLGVVAKTRQKSWLSRESCPKVVSKEDVGMMAFPGLHRSQKIEKKYDYVECKLNAQGAPSQPA